MIKRLNIWWVVLAGVFVPSLAHADPFQLSYGGRMVRSNGQPQVGPVDIQLKLFRDEESAGSLIPVTVPIFNDVILSQGAFHVSLALSAADYHTVFDATDVWVEVKDVTNKKTYPRQRFMAVPYALKVPVDGVTVLYDASGRLRAVTGGTGNMNTGTYDATGTIGIVDQAELANDSLDAQLLGGNAPADFHDAAQLTGAVADARLSATVTNLGDDISLTTEVTGVLPVANLPVGTGAAHVAAGNDGRFTDSRAPNGSATGDLTGSYPSPQIAAGVIVDADVNGSAAIATSKLSGPVTSIASHGLGTMATQGAGAVTITGGTIAGVTQTNFTSTGIDDNADALAVTIDSTERVGIGTTTPDWKLTVAGGSTAGLFTTTDYAAGTTGSAMAIATGAATGNTYGSIQVSQAGGGGTGNLVLQNAGGNVGIGTPSPGASLEVQGSSATTLTGLIVRNTNNTAGTETVLAMPVHNGTNGLQIRQASNITGQSWSSGNYDSIIRTGQSGAKLHFAGGVSANPQMTVDNGGNVGIGITAPTATLDVAGEVKIGTGSTSCVVAAAGLMRYNTTTKRSEACVSSDYGTTWSWLPITSDALTGNRNYYVRTDGSNSNTGLANTAGGAFLTIQKAIDTIAGISIGPYSVTINVADGTYTTPVIVSGPWQGTGTVAIVGNTTTPANVIFSVTSSQGITVDNGGRLIVSGMEFRVTTVGAALLATNNGVITVGTAVRFGPTAGTHMWAYGGGNINVVANYSIVGNATYHVVSERSSTIQIAGITVTLTGTPVFSVFATANFSGILMMYTNTYVGSATGQRYSAQVLGNMYVNGCGATCLPGSTAGGVATGGQYN